METRELEVHEINHLCENSGLNEQLHRTRADMPFVGIVTGTDCTVVVVAQPMRMSVMGPAREIRAMALFGPAEMRKLVAHHLGERLRNGEGIMEGLTA